MENGQTIKMKKKKTRENKHIPKSSIAVAVAAAAASTVQRTGLRKLFLAIKLN